MTRKDNYFIIAPDGKLKAKYIVDSAVSEEKFLNLLKSININQSLEQIVNLGEKTFLLTINPLVSAKRKRCGTIITLSPLEKTSLWNEIWNNPLIGIAIYQRGKFLKVNPTFVKLLNIEDKQESFNLKLLSKKERRNILIQLKSKAPFQIILSSQGGSPLLWIGIPLNYSSGWCFYLLVIEEMKEIEDFLALLSHEFKSNFSVILGFAEFIDTKTDAPLIKESIQKIYTSCRRALDILEDMLTLVTLDRKEIKLKLTKVNLYNSLEEIIKQLSIKIKKKELTVINKVPSNLTVFTDESKLFQILQNLISNAIKFSFRKGEIVISTSSSNTEPLVELQIADNGVGIREEDFEKIFKKFVRLRTKGTEGEVGTGLGLSIVKKLAELLDIPIKLTSELGKGTTFSLILRKG